MSTCQFKPGDLVRRKEDDISFGIVLRVRETNTGQFKGSSLVCVLDSDSGDQLWFFESRLVHVEAEEEAENNE